MVPHQWVRKPHHHSSIFVVPPLKPHVNLHCQKNPDSSWSKSCSSENTNLLPPKNRTNKIKHHFVKSTRDFSFDGSQQTPPPPASSETLPKLKLPFASDKPKWEQLEKKLKPILLNRFPLRGRESVNLDTLVDDSALFIRTFLEKECGIKKKTKKKSVPSARPTFSRTYYRLRARKRKLRSTIKKIRKTLPLDVKLLAKLKYQRRALIRSLARRKKAELKIFEAKQLLKTQSAFNKNPHRFSKNLFSSSSNTVKEIYIYNCFLRACKKNLFLRKQKK